MNEVRLLFKKAGLLANDGKFALNVAGLDPWRLRAEGLDRKLTGQEFAIVLVISPSIAASNRTANVNRTKRQTTERY
jgi:hypothetical protein